MYNNNIYENAEKDGIDTTNWNILIDYVKKYKEDYNVYKIKNKIVRSRSLILLFNDNKYKDIEIQEKLKKINFSFKTLYNLEQHHWEEYRMFIENKLNKYIEDRNKKLEKISENNIKNKLIFPCKNESCIDYVDMENVFCDDCKKDLKPCKNCKEMFWTDDDHIKYCDDCGDYNE